MRYSIVVPTRERANTLEFTLRSCLSLDYDEYEIVVCDNCSSPATANVVNSFRSPKILYHRSPEPLSMGQNWNLAYSLTSGDYVIYIGDDDAILPFALKALDYIIDRHKTDVVRWTCGIYCWPDIPALDLANYLSFCFDFTCKPTDGRATIREALAFRQGAAQLPNIYHGCVARSALEKIKATTGHVFASYNCDTYSSVAVAYVAERYISLAAPLSLSGFSAHSNNVAFSCMRGKHKNTQAYHAQNAASGVALNPRVPNIADSSLPLIDSFLTAKAELFPEDSELHFDRRAYIERMLDNPPIDELDEWPDLINELRRSLRDDPDLQDWFERRVLGCTPKVSARTSFRVPLEGLHFNCAFLSADVFQVTNVYDATKLVEKLLNFSTWDFRDASALGENIRRQFAALRRRVLLYLLAKRPASDARL